MPQIIEVPGVGEYEFPDDTPDSEISEAIDRDVKSQGLRKELAAEQASWRLPERALNTLGTLAEGGTFKGITEAPRILFNLPHTLSRALGTVPADEPPPQFPRVQGTNALAGVANLGISVANSAPEMMAAAIPGVGAPLIGAFAEQALEHLPEAARAAGEQYELGTPAEKVEAVGGLALQGGVALAPLVAGGLRRAERSGVPEFPTLPDPDVVARGAAAPRDVVLAGERVGTPKNQIAGEAPFLEAPEGMINFDLPYRELRASTGRLVRFEDPVVPPEGPRPELQAEGKMGFAAEAPTKTSNVPDRTADAILREKAADTAATALDPIESALTRAIEFTDPTRGGATLEGVTGFPVWLTKSAANGALKVALTTYRAGKSVAKAIDAALAYLRSQRLSKFSEEDAIRWLEGQLKEQSPVDAARATPLLPTATKAVEEGAVSPKAKVSPAAETRSPDARLDAAVRAMADATEAGRPVDPAMLTEFEAAKAAITPKPVELKPPPAGAFEEMPGVDPALGRWWTIKEGEYKSSDGGTYRAPDRVSEGQMRMLGFEPPPRATPKPAKATPKEGQRARQAITRAKADPELTRPTREAVGNEFYDPRSNADTNAAVSRMIDAEGLDAFLNRIILGDPALKGEERVAGSYQVVRRFDRQAADLERAGKTAEADAIRDRVVQTIELVAEREGTELGRAVQAFRMWAALSPEGMVRDYAARVKAGRAAKIARYGGQSSVEKFVNVVRSREYAGADPATRKKMLLESAAGGGRIRKAFRAAAGELSAMKDPAAVDARVAEILTKTLKLPEVDKAFSRELLRKVEAAMKKPEGFQRDYALSQIAGEIRQKIGLSAKDVGTAWWYASILSSPVTQIVNVGASMLQVGANLGLTMTLNPKAVSQVVKGIAEGLSEGVSEARAILGKGDYSRRESGLFEPATLETAATSPNRLHRALSIGKFVGRAMTAADMVNYKVAEQAMARVLARDVGVKEGLRGEALTRRISEILHNTPELKAAALEQARAEGLKGNDLKRRVYELVQRDRPADLLEKARDFGLESTFNEKPYGVAGMIGDLASQAAAHFAPIRLIVPFTRIVSNVFNEQLNWTPYGYWRAFRGSRPGSRWSKEAPEGQAYRLQLAKATVGTVGLATLFALAKTGQIEITASGPTDSRRRFQLMETGWKPNSIKVGNTYVSWLNTPMALTFALIGHRMDGEKYGKLDEKDFPARMAFVLGHAGASLLSQSFLTGLSDFLGSLKGRGGAEVDEKALAKLVSRSVTSFAVPNLVRWVDRIMDPTITRADTLQEIFLRDLPVARSLTGKPIINALGEPVTREGGDRYGLDRFASLERSDPVWALIAEKQAFVGVPSKNAKLGDRTMTPEEYYDYMETSGKLIRRALEAHLPRLQAMPPEQVQAWVKEVSSIAREATREKLLNAALPTEPEP